MSTLQAGTAVREGLSAVVDVIGPALEGLLGTPPVEIEFWTARPSDARDGPGRLRVNSLGRAAPDRLVAERAGPRQGVRRRATSTCSVRSAEAFRALQNGEEDATTRRRWPPWYRHHLSGTRRLRRPRCVRRPPPPPRSSSPAAAGTRCAATSRAISHHYDVGNEFYELVLGPAMTYSCARFVDPHIDLATAQAAKHELICRKLGLARAPGRAPARRRLRLGLDGDARRAHHTLDVVGITISEEQAPRPRAGRRRRARRPGRDPAAGLPGGRRRAVRRHLLGRHVRARRVRADATRTSRGSTASSPTGPAAQPRHLDGRRSRLGGRSFVDRYVFPDGELIDVGEVVLAMERAGFEVRDVEKLREHYALTLRGWVANLEANWDAAVALVGERPSPGVAALHGRVGHRLRRRGPPTPPGARRAQRAGRHQFDADRRCRGSGLTTDTSRGPKKYEHMRCENERRMSEPTVERIEVAAHDRGRPAAIFAVLRDPQGHVAIDSGRDAAGLHGRAGAGGRRHASSSTWTARRSTTSRSASTT